METEPEKTSLRARPHPEWVLALFVVAALAGVMWKESFFIGLAAGLGIALLLLYVKPAKKAIRDERPGR